MRRSCPASLSVALLVSAFLLGVLPPKRALAHKVVVFATRTGKNLEGEVYFHGGAAARNVKVTIVGPEGQVFGQTETDEEGQFTFPVRFRCDYKVIADAGEGHGAEYTVPADELPQGLPLPGGDQPGSTHPEQAEAATPRPNGAETATASESPGQETAPPTAGEEGAPAPAGQGPVASPDPQDLQAEVQAVVSQLAALRRDLNEYENELRLRDVLGGLGYILGIMGLAFYFLGVRRKEKRSASTESPIDC